MKWLFADWGENKRHVFDAVRQSLQVLGHECDWISRNDMQRRPELIAAIVSGDYDALLTWQRFYPMQRDLLEAVSSAEIKTVFMDYGFLPHYESVVFDRQGENASSSWLSEWENGGPILAQSDFERVDRIIADQLVAARWKTCPNFSGAECLRYPFIFVPLQRVGDSVIRYDSTVHDFGRLVHKVLFLAKGRFFVVIKTHPLERELDLGLPDLVADSHVVIRTRNDANNEEICEFLLRKAGLVVGINSNMLFRAMLYGTPVIAAGRGWYTGSNVVHEVDGVENLNHLQAHIVCAQNQRRYLATCLSRQLLFEELRDPVKLAELFSRLGLTL